jgi:hypothetical protein
MSGSFEKLPEFKYRITEGHINGRTHGPNRPKLQFALCNIRVGSRIFVSAISMAEEEDGSRPKAPDVSPNEIGQCAAEAPVSSSHWIVRSSSIRNQCFLPTVDRAALRRLRASSPSSSSPDTPGYEDDTPELDVSTDSSLDLDVSDSVGPTIEAHSYWPKRAWQHWTCAVVVIVLCVTAVSVQCVHRPDFMGSLLFLGRMVTNCWTDPGWGNSTWTPHNGVYPFAKDLSFTMTRRDSMDVEQGANASLLLSVRYTEHPSREPVRFSGADQLPRCRWVRFPPGSAPYCGALGADNMHRRLRKPVLNSTRRDYTRLHLERAK